MNYKIKSGMNFHGNDANFIQVGDVIKFEEGGDNVSLFRDQTQVSGGKYRKHGNGAIGYLKRFSDQKLATVAIKFLQSAILRSKIQVLISTLPSASDDTAGEWEGEEEIP
jgi:hypothetical protein